MSRSAVYLVGSRCLWSVFTGQDWLIRIQIMPFITFRLMVINSSPTSGCLSWRIKCEQLTTCFSANYSHSFGIPAIRRLEIPSVTPGPCRSRWLNLPQRSFCFCSCPKGIKSIITWYPDVNTNVLSFALGNSDAHSLSIRYFLRYFCTGCLL